MSERQRVHRITLTAEVGSTVAQAIFDNNEPLLESSLGQAIAKRAMYSAILAASRDSLCRIAISRDDHEGVGRLGADSTVLLVPRGQGFELMLLETSFLPVALFKLHGVSELRSAGDRAPTADFAHVSAINSQWRIQMAWKTAGVHEGADLHVLEAADGAWVLELVEGQQTLMPVTPSDVFRALVALLPIDEELVGAQRS